MREAHALDIVVRVRNRRSTDLPQMFTTRGLDQSIRCIIGVLRIRIDTFVHQVLTGAVDVEIYYPRKIRISYNKRPEPEYLKQNGFPKDVGLQITYVDFRDGIVIMENGYYYDQRDWLNQGYWSWKNVADLLPYDYVPD